MNKNQHISSLQIINLIPQHELFYQIPLNGKVEIDANFEVWSEAYFDYQINEVGLMYSAFFIHQVKKNSFSSLDEFMTFTRLNENKKLIINDFGKYPFTKKEKLSKQEFQNELELYLNDIFLCSKKTILDINIDNYQEGFFYFKEPSIITFACDLGNDYYAFSHQPYI
jgi:hypothetical protein